ncbi:hypothetical protein E2C01_056813 [Portunus trituberculatus]|uniref:Uncharacterized protein n=1 Tax=Portunus trituberculatus TaxID=210409 RepID=A0A5B7H1M5_PORTR|nr:hypothetical protein [Portunus trituberculatus]
MIRLKFVMGSDAADRAANSHHYKTCHKYMTCWQDRPLRCGRSMVLFHCKGHKELLLLLLQSGLC